MIRREFITLLGGAAAWPQAARAQKGDRVVPRIGVLMSGNENDLLRKTYVSASTQALAGLGWTDGRNARIDLRWFGDDNDRIRAPPLILSGLQRGSFLMRGLGQPSTLPRKRIAIPRLRRREEVGDTPSVVLGQANRLSYTEFTADLLQFFSTLCRVCFHKR